MPPLPPAPSKRATHLSPEAFSTPQRKRRSSDNLAQADPINAPEKLAKPKLADMKLAPPVTSPNWTAPTGKRDSARQKSAQSASVMPSPGIANTAKSQSAPARRKKVIGPSKLFVLDTNVLMHDPMCLFRFEEHDIYLPMIVLEELDNHKRGMTEVARNVRQTSRMLDALVALHREDIATGLELDSTGHTQCNGKLFFQTQPLNYVLPESLPLGRADNQILGVVEALRKLHAPREVVLVSKDINIRVKARALGLPAEDYQNDKALEDGDILYSGSLALPVDFWNKDDQAVESWQQGPHTFYRISGPVVDSLMINQFVFFESPGEPNLYARVTEIRGRTAVLRTLKDYTHLKNAVWGVTMRNREQNFAMNLLMDPEVDFVSLTGTAGTGKTLMALAAGLTQVLDDRRYTEIIVTRATVNVGEDIGFLPGTEEEKMGPWMGALDDNLEVLSKTDTSAGEWGRAATTELIRSRIKIKSMNFMRGRTFLNKYVIIDEAQNLTPKQMKTLITRAGPGTKIICMGNLAQIDTPYLTEGSSGLTFAVDRFKGWPHGGHITLARGERSRLADFASEVL